MSFEELLDLASRAVGGSVVAANNEFFAERDNLVNPWAPTFTPRTFGAKGQVYDGWETRRRREPGHDLAVLRLGAPGHVHGVVVDTAFFTGNYPPEASVEGCRADGYPSPAELAGADWFPLVERSALLGDTRNRFPVDAGPLVTHVRLTIHPDGGVARLRVHGTPAPDPRLLPDTVDLAAAELGGRVVDCSDRFYGSPGNLLLPGLATSMGEGWETRRRRDGGNDWVQVRLAAPGVLALAELDTSHFKGNAPGWAALTGSGGEPLLARTRLQPDTRHRFRLSYDGPVDGARLDIYPDGGMARLRLYGSLTAAARERLAAPWTDQEAGGG
ncbi:allantoicase [Catellatospora citrea]|uniref:Probable allantoicase n=1 Tax=Catellatospora citrea TaxID=53366 RepID=A0A8J3KEG8_9ACTN|nr:allantoicase [Catellatospora citrea]RKE06571.1 allantoicase [Catellatospora citrea]GIF98566.1 putative allantoicase [Catellatospora citrea]